MASSGVCRSAYSPASTAKAAPIRISSRLRAEPAMIRAIMASLRRKQAIEERKHALTNLLYREPDGIVVNRHYDGDGAIIYRQACALGCEGIVSKRRGSPYRSGRTDHWLPVI